MTAVNISDSDQDAFYSCESSSSAEEFDVSCGDVLLGDVLHNTFSTFTSKTFNVCHINAQSIASHYSDLLTTFYSNHIHAILISESFLKPSLASTNYALPGFILLRNDRTGKGGGGVAIYLRSNLKFKIISQSLSAYHGSFEHIFIEINFNSVKFLLGVVYAPPTIDYFSEFETLLENLLHLYEHNLIMGDFNTCLIKNDSRSKKLNFLISSINASILPLNSTFHLNNANSLLDLIITSNPSKISSHGQFLAPGFSHHDLIYASYLLKTPKYKPKVIMQRNFVSLDPESLWSDALKLNWTNVTTKETLDEMVGEFNRLLLELYDKHAPIRPVRIKQSPAPWLNDEIRKAMRWRDALRRKDRKSHNEDHWNAYKYARNRVNQMCRNAKRRYVHTAIGASSSQNVWRVFRSLGFGKPKSNILPSVDINGLNQHFSSLPISIDPALKAATISDINSTPLPNCVCFSFSPVSTCEIKKIILSISSKAVGTDSIGRALLIPILDVLLYPITHIINFSLSTGSFPTLWKDSFIIPIPKKPSPSDFSHLRPISILPFISKVLERTIHRQFTDYLNKNSLFDRFQSGFRSSHSTSTALIKITDDVRLAMDRRELTLIALLDFSNAFNCVDHDILLAILSSLNISQVTSQWFDSYLRGRRQRIRVDDQFSNWCSLTAGLPQGGVLSPLLFSVFINTITYVIRFSSYHLYADDLQLYRHFSFNEIDNAISEMNRDLECISLKSEMLGLLVNPSKTQVIIIGTKQLVGRLSLDSMPTLVLNNTPVPYSVQVKNLGLHMSNDLSWNHHVSEVCRRVYGSMHTLKRSQNFIPRSAKITLVNALLLPLIDYADISYPDLTEELLDKLDRLQNMCIRYVFGLRKYDHVSQFRNKLQWLNIRLRRSFHLLTSLYNILYDPLAPPYLNDRFEFLCDSHSRSLRSSANNQLKIPSHSSSKYSSSFSVSAARQWNKLPLTIRQSPTLNSFKLKLFRHYLDTQNNSA